MRAASKALRANERHKTRFHTERDQLLPLGAWPGLFRSAFHRLAHHRPDGPWLAPSAVRYLDSAIQPSWTIFEFGSGTSTAWFARRARSIVSVEDNPEWFSQVRTRMSSDGITNCTFELLASAEAFPNYIKQFNDNSFDLVIVDGNEPWPGHRLECLAAASAKVKPGGLVVLDDSDRVTYRGADDILATWPVRRFVDIKPFPLTAVETSIFVRPPQPIHVVSGAGTRAE